jgi:hypothetical protein
MQKRRLDHQRVLRSIVLRDTPMLEGLLAMHLENQEASGLEPRDYALVKIAGLIGANGPAASFAWHIGVGREGGLTDEDISGVLVALAPTVGMARVVSAATEMALAMHIDVEKLAADAGKRPGTT